MTDQPSSGAFSVPAVYSRWADAGDFEDPSFWAEIDLSIELRRQREAEAAARSREPTVRED